MSKLRPPPSLQMDPFAALFLEKLAKRVDVAAVTDPSGGSTVDTECRTALIALMDAMRESGLLDE